MYFDRTKNGTWVYKEASTSVGFAPAVAERDRVEAEIIARDDVALGAVVVEGLPDSGLELVGGVVAGLMGLDAATLRASYYLAPAAEAQGADPVGDILAGAANLVTTPVGIDIDLSTLGQGWHQVVEELVAPTVADAAALPGKAADAATAAAPWVVAILVLSVAGLVLWKLF